MPKLSTEKELMEKKHGFRNFDGSLPEYGVPEIVLDNLWSLTCVIARYPGHRPATYDMLASYTKLVRKHPYETR